MSQDLVLWQPQLSNIQLERYQIGEGSRIHSHVWIGNKVCIGKGCNIQAFCYLPNGVVLEDKVFLAPHVCFTNDLYPPSGEEHWLKTVVKRGAAVGANSTIICGVTIGEYALIGAGSVVTKDVPPGELWVGNPARFVRKR